MDPGIRAILAGWTERKGKKRKTNRGDIPEGKEGEAEDGDDTGHADGGWDHNHESIVKGDR